MITYNPTSDYHVMFLLKETKSRFNILYLLRDVTRVYIRGHLLELLRAHTASPPLEGAKIK